jgi:hypothetical protein
MSYADYTSHRPDPYVTECGQTVDGFVQGKDHERICGACQRLLHPKRFPQTFCSECGQEFGPGSEGFSHCEDHEHLTPLED